MRITKFGIFRLIILVDLVFKSRNEPPLRNRGTVFSLPVLATCPAKFLEADAYFIMNKIDEVRSQGSSFFLKKIKYPVKVRSRSVKDVINMWAVILN